MQIILQPSDLSFPMEPEQLFGRKGPLVVEIGFGNGGFLCRLAERNPSWNLIGAEISPSSVMRAYKRITRSRLRNVRLVAGAGEFVVRNMIPDVGLDLVYVNFPDPWPRRRHHDRRLLSQSFFELLACRLKTHGSLFLTTDHEDYCRFAEKRAAATGCFRLEAGAAPTEALGTRWARRWVGEGRSIYHLKIQRTAEPKTSPKRIEVTEMQHSLLRGNLAEIVEFEKFVVKEDGTNIVVSEVFRQVGEDAVIFPTIVEENDLRQFVLIEAHSRGDEVLVGVKRFGRPLSTPGVNRAVTAVADYLERQGLEILERTY